MAKNWNTIHIFGFGTVQVISDTKNVQAPVSAFQKKVDLVIDDVWAKKPTDYQGEKTYHAVNCFNELFADWLPKENNVKSFRVQAADLDHVYLNELAEAVLAYVPPTE